MKKTYIQPEIGVEELEMESPLLRLSSKMVTNTAGNASIGYGGGGSSAARTGESTLWDDEDDSDWDSL